MGWTARHKYKSGYKTYGDGARLRRTLGMRVDSNPDVHGQYKVRKHMLYKSAVQIIRAIERDPWEFDL